MSEPYVTKESPSCSHAYFSSPTLIGPTSHDQHDTSARDFEVNDSVSPARLDQSAVSFYGDAVGSNSDSDGTVVLDRSGQSLHLAEESSPAVSSLGSSWVPYGSYANSNRRASVGTQTSDGLLRLLLHKNLTHPMCSSNIAWRGETGGDASIRPFSGAVKRHHSYHGESSLQGLNNFPYNSSSTNVVNGTSGNNSGLVSDLNIGDCGKAFRGDSQCEMGAARSRRGLNIGRFNRLSSHDEDEVPSVNVSPSASTHAVAGSEMSSFEEDSLPEPPRKRMSPEVEVYEQLHVDTHSSYFSNHSPSVGETAAGVLSFSPIDAGYRVSTDDKANWRSSSLNNGIDATSPSDVNVARSNSASAHSRFNQSLSSSIKISSQNSVKISADIFNPPDPLEAQTPPDGTSEPSLPGDLPPTRGTHTPANSQDEALSTSSGVGVDDPVVADLVPVSTVIYDDIYRSAMSEARRFHLRDAADLFDRFMTEEAETAHVALNCPAQHRNVDYHFEPNQGYDP